MRELTYADALKEADYIIGPTPFTKDGASIHAPLHGEKIYIDDFLRFIKPSQKLMGGGIIRAARELIAQYRVDAVDILTKKELTALNAIPTAEGAAQIAIESSPITLHNANALVVGFGNIGKVLTKLLIAFGANITATSRRAETDAEIAQYSVKAVRVESLSDVLGEADFIFNTAPSVIIDAELCKLIRKEAVYIELASSPYGIDKDAARDAGVNVIDAPNLPGKVAPKTTAGYNVNTVYNIIREGETT